MSFLKNVMDTKKAPSLLEYMNLHGYEADQTYDVSS